MTYPVARVAVLPPPAPQCTLISHFWNLQSGSVLFNFVQVYSSARNGWECKSLHSFNLLDIERSFIFHFSMGKHSITLKIWFLMRKEAEYLLIHSLAILTHFCEVYIQIAGLVLFYWSFVVCSYDLVKLFTSSQCDSFIGSLLSWACVFAFFTDVFGKTEVLHLIVVK
jgi:hypothetical protein